MSREKPQKLEPTLSILMFCRKPAKDHQECDTCFRNLARYDMKNSALYQDVFMSVRKPFKGFCEYYCKDYRKSKETEQ